MDKEVISLNEIKSLGLYHNTNRKEDDDIIIGTYKDIPITIVETKLSQVIQTNNQPSINKKIFDGLILKIKMNKDFEGITVGEQKVNIDNYIKLLKAMIQKHPEIYSQEILGFIDNPVFRTISQTQKFMSENKLLIKNGKLYVDIFDKYTKNQITRGLESIKLEDSEFNDNYNLYSNNQVEVRYLLTPTFMEKLKNIQSTFLVLSVDFAFNSGYLYLFLDNCAAGTSVMPDEGDRENKGFFEAGSLDTTLLDKKIYLKLFIELVSIFSLINYFKLNEKTGL